MVGSRRATISNGGVATNGSQNIRSSHTSVKSQDAAAMQSPLLANSGVQPLLKHIVQISNGKQSALTSFASCSPSLRSEVASSLSSDVRTSAQTCSTNVAGPEFNGIHLSSGSTSGGAPALNTELRAMARRQRELSRDKGREKLFLAPPHHQAYSAAAHLVHTTGGVTLGAVPHNANISDVADNSATPGAEAERLISVPLVPPSSMQQYGAPRTNIDGSQQTAVITQQVKKTSPRIALVKVNGSSMFSTLLNTNNHQGSHTAAVRSVSSQKTQHHVQTSNNQSMAHQQRLHVGSAAGVHKATSSQSVMEMPTRSARQQAGQPVKALSELDGSTALDGLATSLQGLGDLSSRIPNPPNAGHEASDANVKQSTMLVRQYYALLEKCQAWQRYAATMKERADNLEIENRFLRDSSRKNEDEVRALERQLRGLKETAMLLDEERRRTESRIGTYNNEAERQRQPSRQRIYNASVEPLHAGLMALADMPSPPGINFQHNPIYSSGSSNAPSFSAIALRAPSRSSNMHSEGDTPPSATLYDIDYINLQENGKLSHQFDAADLRSHKTQATVLSSQDYVPASLHQQRQENAHLAELLAQDAARREMSSLQGAAHQALVRSRMGMTESRSFPSCDVAPSSALTTQILAAHTREHDIAAAINRLPSSTSAPVLRPKAKNQSPRQQPLIRGSKPAPSTYAPPHLRHHVSEGNDVAALKTTSQSKSDKGTFGLGLQNANLEDEHLSKVTSTTETGRLSAVPGSRTASAQSDAKTVTEDYLQGMVEQKRQLRKISLSQQQQMHFLQARIQINRSNSSLGLLQTNIHKTNDQADENDENIVPPSTAPLPSMPAAGLDSRPGSRLSNNGSRRRPRSRAGSYSFHDAIPVDKDDVFSSQPAGRTGEQLSRRGGLKRSESAPLGTLNLNGRSGAVSALELRHYAEEVVTQSDKAEQQQPQQQRQQRHRDLGAELNAAMEAAETSSTAQLVQSSNDTGDGSVSGVSRCSSHEDIGACAAERRSEDNDPKGAHRRLYIRLREELDPTELVRFERYVHRYDALQIEMEGPKGIINRVRRLLLPEEVVRSKHTHRERYQFRKELAREFERIVRDDAVPSETHSQQERPPSQQQHSSFTAARSPSHAFV